ncbi:MAG: O-antigen ligase family protein [Oscillospiraceae bacterium]|nr:O-antigen ligase family protein [Oscillospiraceae bacterium]
MYTKFETWQSRIAGLAVILLLCVQPLYVNAARYYSLTWHKFVFFAVSMGLILLASSIIWTTRLASKPKLGFRERPYLADWAALGFALVTLLSALFSPYKDVTDVWLGVAERYDGAITQLLYVAAFLVIAHWYKPHVRHFVFFGIAASLIGIIGILQFYGMDFLKLWPTGLSKGHEYYVENLYHIPFRSTLGNVDIVSTYVCAAILLCGFLFIRMKSKWQPLWLVGSALCFWLMELADAYSGRVGVIVAIVLAMPYIVETLKTLGRTMILASSWLAVYILQKLFYDGFVMHETSVGALLPLIAGFCVLLAAGFLLARKGKEVGRNSPVRWKIGVLLIAVCIFVGIAGVEVLGKRDEYTGNKDLLADVRDVLHGNIRDELGTNRIYIWRNALSVYPEQPIIGTGPDTFGYAFPEEAQYRYEQHYDKAHNEYVQILICQGILGLLLYLLFLVASSLKSAPQAFRNPLLMGVLAAFVGYCVQAFFNISLPIASQLLWVFAGMLANKQFSN